MLIGVLLVAQTLSAISLAGDVHCPPDLGEVEVDGNLVVAAPCRLAGTTVSGDVRLFEGGSLVADRVDIRGNVRAKSADFLVLLESLVDGDVRLEEMVGDASRVALSEIDGKVELTSNRSRLEMQDNRVDGDLRAERNTGGVLIKDNVIEGNLRCRRNEPAPVGGGNRVSGKEEDQCASLAPLASPTIGDNDSGATDEAEAADDPTGSAGEPNAPEGGASNELVLDPQPSGGGAAVGLVETLLMMLVLLAVQLRRRRAAPVSVPVYESNAQHGRCVHSATGSVDDGVCGARLATDEERQEPVSVCPPRRYPP